MFSNIIARLALRFCLALLISANLAGRPQQPSTGNAAPVMKTKVNEVVVPVVVSDSEGQIVDNLTKQDFQVFDEGKPQVITGFQVVKRAFDAIATSTPSPPNGHDTPAAARPFSATSRFAARSAVQTASKSFTNCYARYPPGASCLRRLPDV